MGNRSIGVALIGSRFMGRMHSHAWRSVGPIFEIEPPRLVGVAARDAATLGPFATRWGWERWTTDWSELVKDPEVGLVDVATPNSFHRDQSLAALEAGVPVACEKPLAGDLAGAVEMAEAAKKSGVPTFVWFSYRRVPAIGLARQLVAEGYVGTIRHANAAYLQGWGGPDTPLSWRFDIDQAGAGAHGDLNAHIIDMVRFVTGEEIVTVSGGVERRFVDERPLPDDPTVFRSSTVDDAVAFNAGLSGGGLATFLATRLATGVKNSNRLEIHGDRGAIRYDFERMNELAVFDATEPARLQGWKTIQCTHPDHPWAGAWWPDGHWLGYEHTFTNTAADILRVLQGHTPEAPLATFDDGLAVQRVMRAAIASAEQHESIKPEEMT